MPTLGWHTCRRNRDGRQLGVVLDLAERHKQLLVDHCRAERALPRVVLTDLRGRCKSRQALEARYALPGLAHTRSYRHILPGHSSGVRAGTALVGLGPRTLTLQRQHNGNHGVSRARYALLGLALHKVAL